MTTPANAPSSPTGPTTMRADGGPQPLAAVLCGLAMLFLLVECFAPQPQLDDSFISYRYARNWVEGHGLVWNPGERVEGITNLLWTSALAGAMKLGAPAQAAGHWLGLASGLAVLAAVGALATAGVPRRTRAIAGLAPLAVVASPAMPYLATSGMETLAFVALIVGALAAQARTRRGLATALVCLALLMRPDGVIVGAAVLGIGLLHDGPLRPASWKPAGVVILVGLALTAWRLAYYGAPVPNTFYAKVGGVSSDLAFVAVGTYFREAPMFLVVPALLALRDGREARAPLLLALGTLLYVLWTGGTGITFSRFLTPIFPVLAAVAAARTARAFDAGEALAPLWLGCLAASAAGYVAGAAAAWSALAAGALACLPAVMGGALSGLAPGRRATATLAASLAVALVSTAVATPSWRNPRIASKRAFDAALENSALARARKLKRLLPADATVGAVAIGVIGHATEFRILDLLGLTDAVIAHSSEEVRGATGSGMGHMRSNSDYVLSQRRPDAILIGRPVATPVVVAVRALWENPALERNYRFDERVDGWLLRARAR